MSGELGVEAWANVNSFLALSASRWSTADPNVAYLFRLGVRLLRQTLELPLPNQRLELNLPAAMAWILNAGRIIYAKPGFEFQFRDSYTDSNAEMYWGPNTFNDERWHVSSSPSGLLRNTN
jgi:hypothetical protein